MEFKQIKELMSVMEKTGTRKLMIKEGDGSELLLERGEESLQRPFDTVVDLTSDNLFLKDMAQHRAKMASALREHAATAGSSTATAPLPPPLAKDTEQQTGDYITAPMVGTLYFAASPDEAPFVKVGDKIDKEEVVCIIEAMKVMNEIKSQLAGTVAEILVENGSPVEFGTKLFRIV